MSWVQIPSPAPTFCAYIGHLVRSHHRPINSFDCNLTVTTSQKLVLKRTFIGRVMDFTVTTAITVIRPQPHAYVIVPGGDDGDVGLYCNCRHYRQD